MARGKKSATELTPRAPTAVESTRVSTPAPTRAKLPSPLPFGHYLPRVPLQLAAVFFSLLAASSQSSTDLNGNRFKPVSRILASVIHEPLRTLPIACASLVFVQAWFGVWAKGCRTRAIDIAENGVKMQEPKPKRPRKTVRDVFGEMWSRAKDGELPHKTMILRATEPGADGKSPINVEVSARFASSNLTDH